MDSNFIFGGIAAAALFAFVRHRHHRRFAYAFHPAFGEGLGPCGFGPGAGRHGWHGGGRRGHGFGRGRFGRGFGRERFLNHLFERLETTHGQEEVLRKEWDTLQGVLRETRENMQTSARAATKAFSAEQFDRASMEANWPQNEEALRKVREAILNFVERAHGVLDAKQREHVAAMLERLQDFRRGF